MDPAVVDRLDGTGFGAGFGNGFGNGFGAGE